MLLPTQAHTTFDDLTGTIAVDFPDGAESFSNLLRLASIDVDQYLPVGLRLVSSPAKGLQIVVLALDRKMQNLYANTHPGRLPVVAVPITLSIETILSWLSGFELILYDPKLNLSAFDLVDES